MYAFLFIFEKSLLISIFYISLAFCIERRWSYKVMIIKICLINRFYSFIPKNECKCSEWVYVDEIDSISALLLSVERPNDYCKQNWKKKNRRKNVRISPRCSIVSHHLRSTGTVNNTRSEHAILIKSCIGEVSGIKL